MSLFRQFLDEVRVLRLVRSSCGERQYQARSLPLPPPRLGSGGRLQKPYSPLGNGSFGRLQLVP
jgi:hypothetical protein